MLEQQAYIGTYIGGYQLTDQLAVSASNRTFLGETASLTERQQVVIKWYHTVHLTTQQEKTAFLREASMLKRLQQPFVLPILSIGLFIDTPYIVTPYMSKGSLSDRMANPAEQRWLQEHALTIIRQIGQTLSYCHQQNVVHGKLHPRNILFNECDEVQLVDFQLVALPLAMVKTANTPVDSFVGEQVESSSRIACKEHDQYALGSIAYTLVTGCKAFTNPTSQRLSASQDTQPPRASGELRPTPPVSCIEEAICKAMTPHPPQHYSTIGAFLQTFDLSSKQLSPPAVPAASEASTKSAVVEMFEPSTQIDPHPALVSCTDIYCSQQILTGSSTPQLAIASANRNMMEHAFLPNRKHNSAQRDIIRRMLSDQGSLFLLLGVLCIIIFSVVGTQFVAQPHAPVLHEQRVFPSHATAVELPHSQPTPQSTVSASRLTHLPPSRSLFFPLTTPAIVQPTPSIHKSREKSSLVPKPIVSHGQSAPFTVNPAYLKPKTCSKTDGYYTCTVTLALSANYQWDQSWYSSSDSTTAAASPSSGFITRGSQALVTIQIASDCTTSGTITFIGSDTNASLTWSC